MTPHAVVTDNGSVWADFAGGVPRVGETVRLTSSEDGSIEKGSHVDYRVTGVLWFVFGGASQARCTIEPLEPSE